MAQREWYADGLRFECTQCGDCCTGRPGFVLFTDEEAAAIAERIGVTPEEFHEKYTHDTAAGRSLAEVKSEFGYDCVFLDRDNDLGKPLCSIHDLRPTQCRTFPFWPENLRTKASWARVAKECEGVNRGNLVKIEDIRIQRDQHKA